MACPARWSSGLKNVTIPTWTRGSRSCWTTSRCRRSFSLGSGCPGIRRESRPWLGFLRSGCGRGPTPRNASRNRERETWVSWEESWSSKTAEAVRWSEIRTGRNPNRSDSSPWEERFVNTVGSFRIDSFISFHSLPACYVSQGGNTFQQRLEK